MIFHTLPSHLKLVKVQTADGAVMWTTTPLANDRQLETVFFHPNLHDRSKRHDDTDGTAASALRQGDARTG